MKSGLSECHFNGNCNIGHLYILFSIDLMLIDASFLGTAADNVTAHFSPEAERAPPSYPTLPTSLP